MSSFLSIVHAISVLGSHLFLPQYNARFQQLTKYSTRFDQFWKEAGIKILKTPVRAPKANAFAECYIGKCKRECLNHFVCVSLG
jgi:hypothetical protein